MKLTFKEWKEAQEYEGRLFGGSYNWARIEGPRPLAHKTSFFAKAIPLARERYNAFRVKAGLQPVTDWKVRPPRDQLIQFKEAPNENA
jgi:hypothetical protein